MMKITVELTGNSTYPRYILALENGCYFDGHGFSPDCTKALKFASLPLVKNEMVRLTKELANSVVELTGTVVVKVTGASNLSATQIENLANYLAEASTLSLDYSHPQPPGLDLVISTQIHWDLKPKK